MLNQPGDSLERIPEQALVRGVSGVNLMPGSLADQLGNDETLLVFLRYFGCLFCREMVADIRAAKEADADYPAVLFFFQGNATEGRAFLRRYWPDVRAIADPELEFYADFGVEQGRFLQVFGPRALLSTRRAKAKGHSPGERSGDPMRMPGLFLVRGAELLWSHRFEHQADHPDFVALPATARASAEARAQA